MTLSRIAALACWLGLIVLGGCIPASASDLLSTANPTARLAVEPTATRMPTRVMSTPASPAPERLDQLSISPTPSPTPCSPGLCIDRDRLVLQRPIVSPGRDTIDMTYRFGTTQGGMRDPHHGVEFLNSYGTPVLAAADGLVVVAGDDRQIFYGPYSYFYGNLIVIEHQLSGITETIYTLYAHLSELSVQAGELVQAGQLIGKVGMTGVATGSHLHFEVRLGENTYRSSRNPELYLFSRPDETGQPGGALVGRILDPQGNFLTVESIVLEHLLTPDGPVEWRIYLATYEEKALVGLSPYEENFAAGDLLSGWYRITFIQNGMQEHFVEILPNQLTVVTYRPGQP
jgi:murein DD-endopeptidase MepM/ murein hydrolase activator NlpD